MFKTMKDFIEENKNTIFRYWINKEKFTPYAEKMCYDPSNPQYTGELNQIVATCCDAILEAFDSIAE